MIALTKLHFVLYNTIQNTNMSIWKLLPQEINVTDAAEVKWVNFSQIKLLKNKSNYNHQRIHAYITKIVSYTLGFFFKLVYIFNHLLSIKFLYFKNLLSI